jgi:hypothetical protein
VVPHDVGGRRVRRIGLAPLAILISTVLLSRIAAESPRQPADLVEPSSPGNRHHQGVDHQRDDRLWWPVLSEAEPVPALA